VQVARADPPLHVFTVCEVT